MKMIRFFLATLAAGLFAASCTIYGPEEPGLLVPKTVDEDASLPSIYVNGTQLHAETYGESSDPMIIALHGGPGGDYRHLLKCGALADMLSCMTSAVRAFRSGNTEIMMCRFISMT